MRSVFGHEFHEITPSDPTTDSSFVQFVPIRVISVFVAIVGCAVSSAFSVLAANEEPVATNTPSEEPSPVTTASEQSPSTTAQAEEKPEVLYTSPSGAFRLERTGEDIWAVSVKDPAQRAKLPKVQILGDLAYPDEFDISPNDEWIFAPYHVGSCLRDSALYRRGADRLATLEEFNDLAWRRAVKLGAFKKDFLELQQTNIGPLRLPPGCIRIQERWYACHVRPQNRHLGIEGHLQNQIGPDRADSGQGQDVAWSD